MRLVAQQFTNKEIARELNISTRAVEERLRSARLKLGAADRRAAARLYQALPSTCEETTGGPTTVDTQPAPTQLPTVAGHRHDVELDIVEVEPGDVGLNDVEGDKASPEPVRSKEGGFADAPKSHEKLFHLEAFDRRFGRIGRIFAILGLAALLAVLLVAGVTIAVVAQTFA